MGGCNQCKEMTERAALFAKGADLLREEKRAILEHLEEGVLTVDGAGRISYVNARADHLLGMGEVLGHSYQELGGVYGSAAARLIGRSFEARERVQGHVGVFELVAIPKVEGVILLFKDGSNQKKMLDMGKEFIANASHELRTPVTIIRGFAETLKDLKEVPEAMYESILEKIIRNCERMESLVKNLLTLADLENSGPLDVVPCDVISILDECAEQMMALHPEIHMERLCNVDVAEVLGEETLLILAFTNVLKNCIKYSKGPASITIRVEAKEDEVYVQVEDRGVGIPEEAWERIFDRFYTVDKTHSRKLGGAGLGLSIVKNIMEKHAASIYVTSVLHQGTTFHFRFYTRVL